MVIKRQTNSINSRCRVYLTLAGLASFFLICLVVNAPCLQAAPAITKPDAMKTLRDWRGRIIAEDEAQSSAQRKQINILSTVTLNRDHKDLEAPIVEIDRLDGERVELEARRRIVDQIIFAIDTKWSGSNLKGFIETQLFELAVNDLSDAGQGGWWKFLIQASVSLRETAEPGADPIRFLEYYMNESGVLEPKSAYEIMKLRNYVGE